MSRIRHEINQESFKALFLRDMKDTVSFFPQMKPEKKALELSDSEKTIFELVKKAERIDLGELKSSAGLSGKQWDKGMKGLNKQGLIKVEVEGDSKMVLLKA